MSPENLVSLLVPVVVLVVLWSLVRHWILPFVLGFALAVALGPQARTLLAGAWSAVAGIGDRVFGTDPGDELRDPERRRPAYREDDIR
ncbi:MAG TPA: hypothetical protein VEA41_21550 [Salinarimonas sp.]|nr:hypothetical protein [Salinarimonas sp.]